MPESIKYQAVIGLEVHAQLSTNSKLFCGDSTTFGAPPNTQLSEITLAHPGTLPKINRKAIEFAVKLGLSLKCDIAPKSFFARKNYFYPDLPKGYQVSQHTTPICTNGTVRINTTGGERDIKLNRIHIEEDAGKSIHDVDEQFTCVDHNRAGVALLEIVSEPDMHSGEEAFAYVTELRKLVRYLGICDGNMEEGSMRCDANISIRPVGDSRLGTRVEVKNLNSIRNVKRAIEYEISRLTDMAERGEQILQETRSFDAGSGTTFSLRSKEEANDYRYFPEPDLPPFLVSSQILEQIRETIPPLPAELEKKYTEAYSLSSYDAKVICDDKETVDYFESVIAFTTYYKSAANWILGPVKSYCNSHNINVGDFPLPGKAIAELVEIVESGRIGFNVAGTKLMEALISERGSDAMATASRLNLYQENDLDSINAWVDEVIKNMPAKVEEYKSGKKALIGLFAGEIKKLSKGKADMQLVNQLLKNRLESRS
ncbi:MAG: Asp-tRNA(Asn)/Glu-tRNA(Gln) amidotransferase subunit GatB [Chitinophagaceae bacterium]